MTVSVCIATYRRNELLLGLLEDLAHQDRIPEEVIIVDNDARAGARATVEGFRDAGVPFLLTYAVQPERNIAMTRNRSVELATGDWLAFIDDDERAPPSWLRLLLETVERSEADGVLAPVVPIVPDDAPEWIRRGRFYDSARHNTGVPVPLECMRFGNVLLRGVLVRSFQPPFNPIFALGAGEDTDLLVRLSLGGSRIVWCDEAGVTEAIVSKKLSLRWLMLRSKAGGQDFARKSVGGEYGPVSFCKRVTFYARVVAQLCIALALAALSCFLGRHYAAHWLVKASGNFGKLSILWGSRSSAWA
jgi:glycosyltransferase involved in cell wall biosynthesis